MILGRLWTIREISYDYKYAIIPPRFLLREQTKQLRAINIVANEAAVEMWEKYFTNPSAFIIEMFEILKVVCSTNISLNADNNNSTTELKSIKTFGNKYNQLEILRKSMSSSPASFEADRVRRGRKFLPTFYITCIIMIFAVFLGILGLAGINNIGAPNISLPLGWLVGVPVGLSCIGIVMCLTAVIGMVR
jgi:hypothetical protein